MRSGWWFAGMVSASWWARLPGCSEPDCFYGTSPYDGQSGVPLDVVVTFAEGAPLPADLPALAPGITFNRIDGANTIAVPFEVRVDAPAGLIEITPSEPLAADAEYEVRGVDADLVSTPHHWASLRRYASVTFSTRSEASLVAAQRVDDGALVLVLSEPLALDDVEAQLALTDDADQPVIATTVGLWESEPHLVVVDDGGLAASAQLGEGAKVYVGTSYESTEILDGYRSLPTCRYE